VAEYAGKVALTDAEGRVFLTEPGEVEGALRAGYRPASQGQLDEVVTKRQELNQYGTTGQQAVALAEKGLRTATFGGFEGFGTPEENAARNRVVTEESPVLSFGAQAAGALVPALAASTGIGALGAAAGLGARGVQAASIIGEGFASGASDELEQAYTEGRNFSVGNAVLFGVGGEVLGRAVPHVLSRGAGALRQRLGTEAVESAVEGAVDTGARAAGDTASIPRAVDPVTPAQVIADGGENVLTKAEQRTLDPRRADEVWSMEQGITKDRELLRTEKNQYENLATTSRKALDELQTDFNDLGDVSKKQKRMLEIVADTSPAQQRWAGERSTDLIDAGELLSEYADKPGLQGVVAKIKDTIRRGSEELDGAKSNIDWFAKGDAIKRSLQQYSLSLTRSSERAADDVFHQAVRDITEDLQKRFRYGLEDKSIWGDAAELQKDVNRAWHDKYFQGVEVTQQDLFRTVQRRDYHNKGRPVQKADPAKLSSFYQKGKIERGLTEERLETLAQGYEDMMAAHAKWKTADPETLARMKKNLETLRGNGKRADEIQGAKTRVGEDDVRLKDERARAKEREAEAKEAEREKKTQDREAAREAKAQEREAARDAREAEKEAAREAKAKAAEEAKPGFFSVLGEAAEFLPGVGPLIGKTIRYGKLLGGLGTAGKAATAQAARKFVRGGLEVTERVAGKAATVTVPVATTALARFQGEYSSPRESFEAKKELLTAIQKDPTVLYRAMGESFGDLPETHPEVFAKLAARLTQNAEYMAANLPPSVSTSMLYPDGHPPSASAIRDTATLWNSVMEPMTVIDDLADGRAQPAQMKHLRHAHEDLYAQLQLDVTRQVAEAYEYIPTQTKLYLNIMFETDTIAGPAHSALAARYIGDAAKEEKQQGEDGPPRGARFGSDGDNDVNPEPTAIGAIKGGVTNSAAA
jgi:hypothetical protein